MPWHHSFVIGGFECATHRRPRRRRIDSIAASRHDALAHDDYAAASAAGMTCVRDGLRWHRIEERPGQYDWTSAQPMIDAARHTGLGVVWDLCHWGWPGHVDIWSADFAPAFAGFAEAAIRHLKASGSRIAGVVPVNEISFWAWAGGEHAGFAPFGQGKGDALKRQLVAAWLAAVARIRALDPAIPILTSEPLIVVHPNPARATRLQVAQAQAGMYEAWDMLLGHMAPELGGHATAFDMMGVNWYPENQWRHHGRRLAMDDPGRVTLPVLLHGLYRRYAKPLLLTETGQEEPGGAVWLHAVIGDCQDAARAGTDMRGVCVYPIMDYPGWDDRRHCPCGLIASDPAWQRRNVRPDILRVILAANERADRAA